MNSLLKRTLSGAVLVVVMVGMILLSIHTLLVLTLLITAVSMHEFYRLSAGGSDRKPFESFYSIMIGWGMISLVYAVVWYWLSPEWFLLLLPAVFLLFIGQLYCKKTLSPLRRIGEQLTALVYIAVPMSLLVALGVQPDAGGQPAYNAGLVLLYVVLIWINDVGAYLVGVTIGKHRLFERLSPKKSWEGFFGGLIFTVLAAVFGGPWITGMQNTPVWVWFIFGVVLTLSAVLGDLVESMFKREAGVKDSGTIIPGHGGFLDRFDAMFISLPFVYVFARLVM